MPSRTPQGTTPTEHRRRNDQIWVHGTVWHSKRVRPRILIEILLDTGAGGGSYMSIALYCTLRQWGGVSQKLSTQGKGALHAANPTHRNIPPMRVLGSARTSIVFLPEDCIHNIAARKVEGLPYGFIIGARFSYTNKSILNFGADKGFKTTPFSPWVSFLDRNMTASNSPSSWNRYCAFSSMTHNDHMPDTICPTPQLRRTAALSSPDCVVWEDDSTLQWAVRVVYDTKIKGPMPLPGFTSIIVKCFAAGLMPQNRQQRVLTLSTEKYDMDRGALVGVARGVQWWDPGIPVQYKIVNRGNLFAKIVRGHPVAPMIAVNTRDTERFNSLFYSSPSTLDPRAPSLEQLRPAEPTTSEHQPHEQVRVEDANCGQLGVKQKAHLDSLLHHLIFQVDYFQLTPNACLSVSTVSSHSHSYINPVRSWPRNSGASGFHQLSIAEKDKHKTAFRGVDEQLWEFNRQTQIVDSKIVF